MQDAARLNKKDRVEGVKFAGDVDIHLVFHNVDFHVLRQTRDWQARLIA